MEPVSDRDTPLFRASLPRFDYFDRFSAEFDSARELTVEGTVREFFRAPPRWIGFLLALRDRIVAPMGLKAAGIRDPAVFERMPIAAGSKFGVFVITAVGPDEVIAGEDDSHLDFRVSIRLERLHAPGRYRLSVGTGVLIKNLLGKLYFAPVKIFHRRIVPALVNGMVKRLAAQ